jgi:hypothetical protein
MRKQSRSHPSNLRDRWSLALWASALVVFGACGSSNGAGAELSTIRGDAEADGGAGRADAGPDRDATSTDGDAFAQDVAAADATPPVDADTVADGGMPIDAAPRDAGDGYPPIDFDTPGATYTLTGFGGAEDSTVIADPDDATNRIARVVKSATAELWAGTTVSTLPGDSVPPLPIDAANTRMRVRVFVPAAGTVVRLKIEDARDPTITCETEATSASGGAWETLTFDFAREAPGTARLDVRRRFDRVSIFFAFGRTGAAGGAGTYHFDELTFLGGGGTGGGVDAGTPVDAGTATGDAGVGLPYPPIDFSTPGVTYTLTGFGGAEDSTVVADPGDPTQQVARVVKSAVAELWAGTTVSTAPNNAILPLPITASRTRMSVRVWSPHAGIHSVETEATASAANAWQTLTFDFANQAPGTAALNPGYRFDRLSLFFNFGTTGGVAGERIYLFDDITMLP